MEQKQNAEKNQEKWAKIAYQCNSYYDNTIKPALDKFSHNHQDFKYQVTCSKKDFEGKWKIEININIESDPIYTENYILNIELIPYTDEENCIIQVENYNTGRKINKEENFLDLNQMQFEDTIEKLLIKI